MKLHTEPEPSPIDSWAKCALPVLKAKPVVTRSEVLDAIVDIDQELV